MMRIDRIVNYASILIILFVGVLFISGMVGIFNSTYRIGFGIVIIAYGVIRLAMTFFADKGRGKKP